MPAPTVTPARRTLSSRAPWLFAASGVLVALAVWTYLRTTEYALATTHFASDATVYLNAIRERELLLVHALTDMARFIEQSPGLDQATFTALAAPLVERDRAIVAIGWNPIIAADNRVQLEQQMRISGHPGFAIRERTADGKLVAAPARDEFYVAVQYIEPITGNEAAVGFNVASEPLRRAALLRAAATGEVAASAAIQLVQADTSARTGLLVFAPSPPTNTRGFVVAVVDLPMTFQAALRPFADRGIGVQVHDTGPLPDQAGAASRVADDSVPALLFDAPARGAAPGLAPVVGRLPVAGRLWEVTLTPGTHHRADLTLTAALTALVLIGGLAGALWAWLTAARSAQLAREIARRIDSEAALRTEEQRLHLTVEAIANGAWDWDVQGETVKFSASWLEALGYTPGTLPASPAAWEQVIHPDDLPDWSEHVAAVVDGRSERLDVSLRLRNAGGAYRTYRCRGMRVEIAASGRARRVVGADTDITEVREAAAVRRQLEHKVSEAQRLESLGLMAGGVAHDFNNLLVGMLSAADLALLQNPGDTVAASLLQIRDAARRAAALTREMLAFAGQGEGQLQPVDLGATIVPLTGLLRSSLEGNQILQVDIKDGPLVVHGDQTQLGRVAFNLVRNAAEATGQTDGAITLRVLAVNLDAADIGALTISDGATPGRYICLEVIDNGPGLDPQSLPRAFDPFFSTKGPGRGLGLAAVLGIVHRHGGAIDVTTGSSAGTTFRVLLPATDEPVALEAPASLPAPPTAVEPARAPASAMPPDALPETATESSDGQHVLVVDDDDMVRNITAALLQTGGIRVLECDSGSAALALLAAGEHDIGLVLLDASMPGMSGAETLRHIRNGANPPPVMMMSGFVAQNLDDALDRKHLAGFLQKPFTARELIARVRAVMSPESATEPPTDPAGPPGGR